MPITEKDLDRYYAAKLMKSFRKYFEPQIFEEIEKKLKQEAQDDVQMSKMSETNGHKENG